MTIEALLTSIDNRLAVLATLLGNEGGAERVEAAAVAPATAPVRRGRGRPAADDPKPATTAAPAALTQVSQPVLPAADPFDDPPPAVPAKKTEKTDVRAALEAYRKRLTGGFQAVGDDLATATNKATTRALAWLNETTGHTTLATLPEDKYAVVVEKAPGAK